MMHCFILGLLVLYSVKYHRLLLTIKFYFCSQNGDIIFENIYIVQSPFTIFFVVIIVFFVVDADTLAE